MHGRFCGGPNCAGLCERNGQQRICLGPGGPPCGGSLLFALICLLNGQERYFKTAIPVYMMALYLCFYTRMAMPLSWQLVLFPVLLYVFHPGHGVRPGGGRQDSPFWVLLLIYLVPLAFRTATTGGAGPCFCAGLGAVSGAGQPVPAGPHSGCFCHLDSERRQIPRHLGRPPRWPPSADPVPHGPDISVHYGDPELLHQLLLRRPGDLCGGAVHPPEAAGGDDQLWPHPCAAGGLRPHGGQVSRPEPVFGRSEGCTPGGRTSSSA